jgi:hypothetical protein
MNYHKIKNLILLYKGYFFINKLKVDFSTLELVREVSYREEVTEIRHKVIGFGRI